MRHFRLLLILIALVIPFRGQTPPAEQSTGSAPHQVASLARMDSPLADFKKKNADDWARQLPSLLPAIEKCVNDARVPVLFVVKAWPKERGMVGVRLEGPHG